MVLSRLKKQKAWIRHLEIVEGMQFDRGYLSPYFVTDAERMEVGFGGCLHSPTREKNLQHEGYASRC